MRRKMGLVEMAAVCLTTPETMRRVVRRSPTATRDASTARRWAGGRWTVDLDDVRRSGWRYRYQRSVLAGAARAGRRYSNEEKAALLSGRPIREVAAEIGRTLRAARLARWRLRRLRV